MNPIEEHAAQELLPQVEDLPEQGVELIRRGWRSAIGNPRLRAGVVARAEAYALLVITALLVVFFSLWGKTSSTFPTLADFQAIAGSQAILTVAALGALVPLVCNEFDVSIGAALGLSAVLTASCLSAGFPLALAIFVGIAAGAGVGILNGVLVARARVSGVVVTLGTASILQGVIIGKTGGQSVVNGIPNSFISFGTSNLIGIPEILAPVIVVAILTYYLLGHTPLGRFMHMVGINRSAARLVGVSPGRVVFASFVASGTISGIAGVLEVAHSGSADPNAGGTYTLPALAAAFLSAAAIKPGSYNVGGVLTAITFLAVINGGLNLAGAQPYVSDIINGAALIAGVALAVHLGRKRRA